MDHLPLPAHPFAPRSKIALRCNPYDSEGHAFDQYPLHSKPEPWERALSLPGQYTFAQTEIRDPSDPAKRADFLQSWLFFCLLRNIFEPFSLFVLDEWVQREDEGRSFLSSHRLSARLDTWVDRVRDLSTAARTELVDKVQAYLRLIGGALIAVDVRPDPTCTNFILAVGALLEQLNDALHDVADFDLYYGHMRTIEPDARTVMYEHGWCPFEVENAARTLGRCSTIYFLQNMRKAESQAEHRACTTATCAKAQIDNQTYRPKHRCSSPADCPMVGPDIDEVKACLDAGSYPVLDLSEFEQDCPIVKVVPYSTGIPYVAVSHVWVDGLGNPAGIQLPRCQLARLGSLVRRFRGRPYGVREDRGTGSRVEATEDRKLLVWCDTLCCPQLGEYYRRALARMKDVYFQAAHVLVLEQSLQRCMYSEIGPLEAMIRISASKWCYRLWTLQEAGLGPKLWFEFADNLISLRIMNHEIHEIRKKDRSRRPLGLAAHVTACALRNWEQNREPDDPEKYRVSLVTLIQDLQSRRLSVPSDEAVCLATLFNLDNEREIVDADPAQRMRLFWKGFSRKDVGISQSIIFHTRPRLPFVGQRWAPKTLLGRNEEFFMCFCDPEDVKSEYTESGLLTTGAAWKVRIAGPPTSFTGYGLTKGSSLRHLPMICSPQGEWSQLVRPLSTRGFQLLTTGLPPDDELPEALLDIVGGAAKEWYIIFDANPRQFSVSTRTALLAWRQGSKNGAPILRSVESIRVTAVNPLHRALWWHGARVAAATRESRLVRCYQLLAKVEGICTFLVQTRPDSIQQPRLRAVWDCLRQARAIMDRRLPHFWRATIEYAKQVPMIRSAYKAAGLDMESFVGCFSLYYDVPLRGSYINAVAEYDKATRWYID